MTNSRNGSVEKMWLYGGLAAAIVLLLMTVSHSQSGTSIRIRVTSKDVKVGADPHTQNYFEYIYANSIWSTAGGGSGLGSSVEYTTNIRAILRSVVNRYNINSMIDLPCGSMAWMPLALETLNEDRPGFRYLGVDIVATQIEKHRQTLTRYPDSATNPTWEFAVLDITKEPIPQGYDLLFSRDALQHLDIGRVIDALENISQAKAKYFLVGSYKNGQNVNLTMAIGAAHGGAFDIDLRLPPFELTDYLHFYDEETEHRKGMLLYTIAALKAANWKDVRRRASTMFQT